MLHRIQTVNVMVREFRDREDIKHVYVQPDDYKDSLEYACEESGEALNADTKARLPKHLRRVRKGHEVPDELSMAAVMLLTAFDLPTVNVSNHSAPGPIGTYEKYPKLLLPDIHFYCASAWRQAMYSSGSGSSWKAPARSALWCIDKMLGDDLIPRVEANLKRIEQRVYAQAEKVAR